MNNDEFITNIIKEKMDKLHKSQNPKKIEKIKKIMKKNVSFFERSNLLSFLILEQIKGNAIYEKTNNEKDYSIKKHRNDNQSAEQSSMLWCNLALDDEEKIDKFLCFVAEKSNVDRNDLSAYKKQGKFSFFYAKRNSANKIVKTFSQQPQQTFEDARVSIRHRIYKK